jgi:hypothetical protein
MNLGVDQIDLGNASRLRRITYDDYNTQESKPNSTLTPLWTLGPNFTRIDDQDTCELHFRCLLHGWKVKEIIFLT